MNYIEHLKKIAYTVKNTEENLFIQDFKNDLTKKGNSFTNLGRNALIIDKKILTILYVNKKYCPIHDVPIIVELKKNNLNLALVINYLEGDFTFKEVKI